MDVEVLLLVVVLLFFSLMVACVTLKLQPKSEVKSICRETQKLEFSKKIMVILLSMWVLGGILGCWVVVFHDFTYLEKVQNYVSYPLTVGIGVYGVKAGAENVKKNSGNTEKLPDGWLENRTIFAAEQEKGE